MDSDDEASENSDDGEEQEPPPKEEVKQSRILVCKILTIWLLKLPPLIVSHQSWRNSRIFCNCSWVHGQFLDGSFILCSLDLAKGGEWLRA